jgi:hypothetical protein
MSLKTYFRLLTLLSMSGLTACQLLNPLSPTQTPQSWPNPTTLALTATPLITQPITALEFYRLAHAQIRQNDTTLVRLDSGLQLEPTTAKSTAWAATFWSPTSRQKYTISLANGATVVQTQSGAQPNSTVPMTQINLNLEHFLATAAKAGGLTYLDLQYRITVELHFDHLNPNILVWTITYLEPSHLQPVFTVNIDAQTGQILQAGQIE